MHKQSANFTVNGARWTLQLELREIARNTPALTIDLEPCPAGALELSISGSYPGGGGQCDDSLARALETVSNAEELREILNIWRRWHLNSAKAGTRAQISYLETVKITPDKMGGSYEAKKAALAEAGLEPDMNTKPVSKETAWGAIREHGYSYGSAWLVEPLPETIAERVKILFSAIDGETYGSALEEPGVMPDRPWGDCDDYIQAEDVQKHIAALREFIGERSDQDATIPENEQSELAQACEELEALERYGDEIDGAANEGERFISDSEFEAYARQMAEDIGAIDPNAAWPLNHIDWRSAARELKQDYSEVEISGRTYYCRA